MVFSTEERVFLVKMCHKSEDAGRVRMAWVRKKFLEHFHKTAPAPSTITRLLKKHEETGAVCDDRKGKCGRPKSVRTPANVNRVRLANIENRQTTSRRLADALDLSPRTVRRILKEDLHLFPYHIQNRQVLTARDREARQTFAQRFKQEHENNQFFIRRVHFSDESHFELDGRVNSHNAIFWGREKPNFVNNVPLHSQKVTVWCAVSFNGVIGPYFFEEDGQTVTVNQQRYQHMLADFFFPAIAPIGNKWMQQDGATAHTANASIALLQERFGEHLISLKTDFPWPPHSPDLTPLDYWLWGDLKGKVYDPKPTSIAELKAAIEREIGQITVQTCRKAIINIFPRLDKVLESNGEHFEHLL